MHACMLVAQSCPTLCDSMDCSPPGSSVRGISEARVLEWVAVYSSPGDPQNQGSNLGLLHCRQLLYCLSHHGNPVCVYIYIHTRTYIYTYIYTYVYMHAHTHTHTGACMQRTVSLKKILMLGRLRPRGEGHDRR